MTAAPFLALLLGQTAASSATLPAEQAVPEPARPAPVVVVDRDNVEIRESCALAIPRAVRDADGNGVVRIVADGVTVDLGGATLDSGLDRARPDAFAGLGIVVAAKGVTLRNGSVRGFKVAISGECCDRTTFEALDVSDNHAQLLKSTREKEDEADWLYPHENDRGEQVEQHGAGLSIANAREVVVRDVRARRTQNGIVLSSVHHSRIYDNDCSFLSGWGLAMWRSSDNVVCRNAFDFCIRGYSHGVYNRGQDSAGILMFEQCSRNVVALNSATHCGDGIFGFAGREALGEKPCPSSRIDFDAEGKGGFDAWYRGRGCNGNLFALNDLSYAAAHGLEMTFSFGNTVVANRFAENGINGVWFGYARESLVLRNEFERNVAGDIAAEHAQRLRIARNDFRGSRTGIALWDDEDPGLAKLPWTAANGSPCIDNAVVDNVFADEGLAISLRAALRTVVRGNRFHQVVRELEERDAPEGQRSADAASSEVGGMTPEDLAPLLAPLDALPGKARPVGARVELRGRDRIVMGAYGPQEPVAGAAPASVVPSEPAKKEQMP
ncbi:MAG: right-handed parallel beta-helix repeat-containing protein [Planctomycetaceae bacterium]|nr:right-handed parallel beta-helix repeat-containing protein [Planctomycetaceae bacterium]